METRTDEGAPKYLGKQVRGIADELDTIAWVHGSHCTHSLDCTEFTSLCPVTGQPDFGRLVITYVPDAHIVETKSLKLWLRRWRERGQFNEVIAEEIATAFFDAVRPKWARIEGRFNHRGGIAVTASTERGTPC